MQSGPPTPRAGGLSPSDGSRVARGIGHHHRVPNSRSFTWLLLVAKSFWIVLTCIDGHGVRHIIQTSRNVNALQPSIILAAPTSKQGLPLTVQQGFIFTGFLSQLRMSGFEMTSMILTSCQTHSVQSCPMRESQCFLPCCSAAQTSPAPNVALRSPLLHGYQMFHGPPGSALPPPKAEVSTSCTMVSFRHPSLAWSPTPIPVPVLRQNNSAPSATTTHHHQQQ